MFRIDQLSPDSQLSALKLDISRIVDSTERDRLEALRAEAAGSDSEGTKRELARFIADDLWWTQGPPQLLYPLLGVLLFVYVIPAIAIVVARLAGESEPLGLSLELFITLIAAGTAGGVVRVIYRSLSRAHRASSALGLTFTGLLHPLIGGIFALAVVAAFNSGFITMPVDSADSIADTGMWSRGDYFLVFAAFVSGFSENFASGIAARSGG
jgi:hypothetical protein